MKRKKPTKNYPDDDWMEYYYSASILGFGSAWGDMKGKVKTAQIGFIRRERKQAPRRKTK